MMKTTITFDEAEIKVALLEHAKKYRNIDGKTVSLNYYQADSRDPREHSYHSATVSE